MRSALDPVPRSLSLRSLAILVSMLVLGTVISVHEYLQSARSPTRTTRAPAEPEETLAGCRRNPEGGSTPAAAAGVGGGQPAAEIAPSLDRSLEDATSTTVAPGMWEIDSRTTGG